ncbi:hypothetical protein [Burkholderia sp. 22PA0106]|uniref:hypothetical protein n=1 Tax=Burkholderia sp. 22PA0106 TaxID=3237371 RepID=UPI0039C48E9E
MFTMHPPLSFFQRLAVWWSYFWRATLATLPIWLGAIVLLFVFYLTARHGMVPKLGENGAFGLAVLVIFGLLAAVVVLSLPIVGYMTRRAFARHGLTVPERYSFRQAVMLGLTTWGWTIVVSLAGNLLAYPFKHVVAASPGWMLLLQLVMLCVGILGAMYVVMPRQARRLRIQTGDPAVLAEML